MAMSLLRVHIVKRTPPRANVPDSPLPIATDPIDAGAVKDSAKTLHVVPRSDSSRASRKGPALGEILVERKTLTEEQLREAMTRQQRTRKRLGEILMELGFASPDAVLDGLSEQLGVPPTRVNSVTVTPEALTYVSEKVARKYTAVPLLKVGSTLVVATANPCDLKALDDLRFATGCEVQTMIALESEIQQALATFYGNPFVNDTEAERATVVVDVPGPQLDLQDQNTQKSASSIVDRILARGVGDRASDIHIEPTKHSLRIRFRVDGMLHEVAEFLPVLAPAVVARLKVLASMDIAVHRNPQDGRFSATINGKSLDVRTSTFPTIWGEKAVLRLLDRSSLQRSASHVMNGPALETFRDLIRRNEGIVLVTGPTGSGKTSTLYAALAELAESGKNVLTIEDPVEYWLPGVSQSQTNLKAGYTFAQGLRAILRQDPNVIMVGEIRDPETLGTAIEASLTGHLVLSTLHTNGTVATVTRLLEMGVEPYLVASSLAGVVAQRLVRKMCEHCKRPVPVPDSVKHLFGDNPPKTIFEGAGCSECRGIGYLGRVGVFELLTMDAELRRLVNTHATEQQIVTAARASGLFTLREEALRLVREGTTTLEEIGRVFPEIEVPATRAAMTVISAAV
jgi:type IV pilus assembly protein PilB